MIALAIALSAVAGQGVAAEAAPRLTVGEWRRLDERQRRVVMVGAIEGVILAASGPGGERIGVDAACLPGASPSGIEAKLADAPDMAPFVLSVVEASGCSR